jgi:hypothetical protein
LALGLTAGLATTSLRASTLPDFSAPPYPHPGLGRSASDIAVGDLNGDGHTDIVTANNGSTDVGVSVALGDGTGELALLGFFGSGPRVNSVALADLNGDGRLDAVTANGNSTMSVLLGNGSGALGSEVLYPYAGAAKIATGDLDGDGDIDVVVLSGTTLSAYLNNGAGILSGSFTRAFATLNCCYHSSYADVVVADVNQDGKTDLAVAIDTYDFGNEPQVQIMNGNGNGTFQATTYYRYPNVGGRPVAYHTGSIAVADVTRDGSPDLVLGAQRSWARGGSVVMVMRNQAGAFAAADATAHFMNDSYGVGAYVGDLNEDGALDIVAPLSDGGLGHFLNDGAGNFGTDSVTVYGMGAVTTAALADLNSSGNGSLDVVMGRSGADVITLKQGTPIVPLPTQTLTILGGVGNFGDIAANVEYFNPATNSWQPAYLVGGHPWGEVPGTTSWINYKPFAGSDPGAGPTTNQTLWYLYRVRFTVPADAINPQMSFSLKADNFAQVAINGVTTGGSTQYLNYTNMPNVIVGEANQIDSDAVFSQAVHTGENTITINMGDWGGLNGFNFRIDLKMQSSEPIEIVPVAHDTTAPVINAPGNITQEATSASGAVATFDATATDDVDGPVPVTASPASGSTFPLGNTTVNLTATDAAGNPATASFIVTVQDTIAPSVTAPASIVAEATSASGATVTYPAATATDAVGVTSIVSNPPSGSIFPLGNTTVTIAAKDAAGNTGGASFTVSVVDTTAPELTVPGNQTLEATSASGAVATFAASATDAVGVTSLTYSASSGTTFAIGTTTVNVTAKDAAGNTSTGSFTVTVRDTTAPAIASVTPSQASLWPPNHQMVAINVSAVSSDAVGVASLKIIKVTSSEPDNGLGDGDTAGDFVITGPLSVSVRAERAGKGDGRIYTITVEARDAAGNTTTKTCTVSVPKNQSGK